MDIRIKDFIAFCKSPKGIFILAFASTLSLVFYFALPKPLFRSPTSFVIEDEAGRLLGASIALDGQWRFPATDAVPEKFAKCIVAFEDRRFYIHPGVDPVALVRAIWQNIRGRRVVSGGSTISMQVIRMSQNKPRTIWQKCMEAVLAFRLEAGYNKATILQLYSAHAPFGSNVVGLDAASWRYFGRAPEQLSWAEAATLAVLPNAPSLIHPGRNRKRLLAKRNMLLDKLAVQGTLDRSAAELAKLEPLPDEPLPLPRLAPHLLERFKKEYGRLGTGVTRLKTSINANLQQRVADIIDRHHRGLSANGIFNAAALVLEVESGKTMAYVGNVHTPQNAEAESHVDMITALRSPGSTLKPLLYAAMLTDGLILPHTLIPDIPTQIGGYTPQNYDLGYDGALPASRALSRSLNIPAVKMLQHYKYQRFQPFLRQAGVRTLDRPADFYGLSMILGGCEVTMWQLAGTYASMARTLNHYRRYHAGYNSTDYRPPHYSRNVGTLPENSVERTSIIDHASLYFTFQAMNEVMRPGEEALWEQFASSKKIAWKTGTSFGFRDGWAIGLTPTHVVCVWVGNADGEGRPGLTGIETAAPILFEIFDLLPARAWFEAPLDRMVQTAVCRESGHLAGPDCPHPDTVYIPVPGHRSSVCPYHQLIHTNSKGTLQVTADCAAAGDIVAAQWFVLPPAMEFYYKPRHATYRELPPFGNGCAIGTDGQPMEMIYPKNNAKIYIPLEIDGRRGQVIFNAAHRRKGSRIYWHLDETFVGETETFHQLALDVPAGLHRITLVDSDGARISQQFEILKK
ncbi:penicillin-binding protein 1C [Parapedobacter koreensis]|uniref:peptidoglycan glycosyltransferase n=1 Tax=Parapedobacter koreensis TaxID=332977 RepID=A0A1H7LC45_9SPHI|nr:penicillin-binding protein 1C [Parapedobacter koreensis]SEK96448.1 penicillin-binding protein 1C [Parapedobacter koreensis]